MAKLAFGGKFSDEDSSQPSIGSGQSYFGGYNPPPPVVVPPPVDGGDPGKHTGGPSVIPTVPGSNPAIPDPGDCNECGGGNGGGNGGGITSVPLPPPISGDFGSTPQSTAQPKVTYSSLADTAASGLGAILHPGTGMDWWRYVAAVGAALLLRKAKGF